MEKFFELAGPMAIGSRLRLLSERMTQEAARVCETYGVDMEPRWFPVLYLLMPGQERSVTELAAASGQSQVSVSQIVKDMAGRGVVRLSKCGDDGRKTLVGLTDAARAQLPQLERQIKDVRAAMDNLLDRTQHNLWLALDEFEQAIGQAGLVERTQEARTMRETQDIEISPFTPADRTAFRDLNVEWIQAFFAMEAEDYEQLDRPEEILAHGGEILMARSGDEPIGCCALVPVEGGFELVKMTVTPRARGRGVGRRLALVAIAEAQRRGAKRLYIESNTRLAPAIRLYEKLGFQRIDGGPSPYARCDIQMELRLEPAPHQTM